jgi:GNAT superfamily N-acetyltransferase
MTVRTARPDDVDDILRLIRGLAEYEHALDEVQTTTADLHRDLFGAHPAAEALIAEAAGGETVGFALFFATYSTWAGRPGIWLEDLFVVPEERGKGHGFALLQAVARIAVERSCGRLEWSVLDWNAPSIAFYLRLGAVPMDEWTIYRMTGEALEALGEARWADPRVRRASSPSGRT